MNIDLEDLAVHIAALSGVRWSDLDSAGQSHYRRLAEDQIAAGKRRVDEPQPPRMPPLKL